MGEPCSWLPDEVILNGQPFKVIQKETGKVGTAYVDVVKKVITINVKGEFNEIKNMFIHECFEGLLIFKGYKYVCNDGEPLYIMDHRKLQDVIDNLTYALKDVLK